MGRTGLRVMAALALLGLLAACATSSPNATPGGPRFDTPWVRFMAPSGWELRDSIRVRFGRSAVTLAYLANQSLRDDCVVVNQSMTCRTPIEALHEGGMLVTWTTSICVADQCSPPPGRILVIGNRTGVRAAAPEGACGDIGQTDAEAYYVNVLPQQADTLFVCSRHATDATWSAFRGFLDAIVWQAS